MKPIETVSYAKALAIPFRIAPFHTILILLSNLISLLLAPVSVLVTAYFIDTALAVVNDGKPASLIVMPLIFIAAFSVYEYMLWPLINMVGRRQNIKTRLALRPQLIEKRVKLEYKHIENTKTLDLLSRVWEDPESQLNGILMQLANFLMTVGTGISFIVILMVNVPIAGVLLIVLSAPMFMLAAKAGRASYEAQREATYDERYANLMSWYLRCREGASERALFGFTDYFNKKFEHHFELSRKQRLMVDAKWFVRTKSSAVILGFVSALGMIVMVPAVVNESLSVGLFIALQGALFGVVNMVAWSLPWHFTNFATQREFIKEFNQFIQLTELADAEVPPAQQPMPFESLEFKNVTFAYPGTEKEVLKNISFRIEKGKNYAFVGENGAGKTTVTKLMTCLYSDYTGEILLNGKPLREVPMSDVKACICVLFQEFARYDISVADNVAIGKILGAEESEIDNAIKLAGFDQTLQELKDGKDTLLGKTHDGSVDLSGGQWQRLAFARAIISPAPIKILDEPTAALDPVAESQVYANFEAISRGFTTIFISHRLASAKMADTIFVLDGGKVAEQGSHDELMKLGGIYEEMFRSQSSWYA